MGLIIGSQKVRTPSTTLFGGAFLFVEDGLIFIRNAEIKEIDKIYLYRWGGKAHWRWNEDDSSPATKVFERGLKRNYWRKPLHSAVVQQNDFPKYFYFGADENFDFNVLLAHTNNGEKVANEQYISELFLSVEKYPDSDDVKSARVFKTKRSVDIEFVDRDEDVKNLAIGATRQIFAFRIERGGKFSDYIPFYVYYKYQRQNIFVAIQPI